MAAARSTQGGFSSPSFADSAFDPHPGFDFDEANEEELRHMHDSVASLNMYEHGVSSEYSQVANHSSPILPSFDPYPVGSGLFAPDLTSSIDSSNVYGDSSTAAATFKDITNITSLPPAFPLEAVQNRPTTVTERFGQVTPPDNTPLEGERKGSESSQSGKGSKLNKSERARNAANQRHAKTKLARQAREARRDAGSGSGSEGSGEDDAEGKREKYREKNRLAAAKCRAKKKDNVVELEEKHRNLSASNNFLRREERALRDELSRLRTVALHHTPAAQDCGCQGLHEYNRRKASQVAFGMGGPMVSSPSDGMISAAPSPDGVGMMGRTNSICAGTTDTSQMFSASQSYPHPGEYGFAPTTSPTAIMAGPTITNNDNPHAFADFLQSSSDGRPGFS